jgi:hypothetical protein
MADMNSSDTGKDKKTTPDIAQLAKDVITKHYTQRQWDRTVGIGKVPNEYKETGQDDSTNNRESEELPERSR